MLSMTDSQEQRLLRSNEILRPFTVLKAERLRLTNNVHFLALREVGIKRKMNTSEMLAMKASQLKQTNRLDFCEVRFPTSAVDFVKSDGDETYIIAACHGRYVTGILHLIELSFRPKTSLEHSPPLVSKLKITEPRCTLYPIVDACFSKMQINQKELLAYVTKTHYKDHKSNVMFYVMGDNAIELLYAVNSQVFSCAFSSAMERFAAGAMNKLYFYEALHFIRIIEVPGMPTALEFDKTGKLIYIGDATSGLRLVDLRVPPSRLNSSIIFPGRVSKLKLLSDENAVILSEGKNLIKVDLRTKRVLLNYPEPELHGLKVPFSISEKADILCSTGLDSVTKLWSLSTSQPLCTIRPNFSSQFKSCILSNDNQWGVALFQSDNMYIFEP